MRTGFLISASVFAHAQAYSIIRKRAKTVKDSKNAKNRRCANMVNDRAHYRRGPEYGAMENGKPTRDINSGSLFGITYSACTYVYIRGAQR